MNLKIDRGDTVEIPAEIVNGPLSLAEIGAIVVLAAIQSGHTEFDNHNVTTPEGIAALKALRERGVFSAAMADGELKISVDLDKAMP